MSVTAEEKQKIKGQVERFPSDTGSTEVQIAILSQRISNLTEHLKKHKRDHGSKKGLYKMVSKRKKLVNYLKKKDPEKYKNTVEKLGLRG